MKRSLVLAVLAVALASCADVDGGTQLACSKFRDLSADARDGLLTDAETRQRLVDIEDDASVSDRPAIADSARRLLSAATPPVDDDGYVAAVSDFIAACNAD